MRDRLADAAAAVGVNLRTVKTWHSTLPHFKQRIEQLRAEMTERMLGVLCDNAASAATTLAFLSRKSKSDRARISAASKVIELLLRTRELVTLTERVAALEAQHQPSARGRIA
jgi:hypothetical protein